MYATRLDIETIYGAEFLAGLVSENKAEASAAIKAALEHATAEIDSYLPKGATRPPVVKGFCVDLACYRLAQGHEALTDELAQRAKDARAWLREAMNGKTTIGSQPSHGKVYFQSQPRRGF